MTLSTVPDLITELVRTGPEREVLVFPEHRLTAVQLQRRGREVAAALDGLGVGLGDHVGCLLPNGPAIVAFLLGVSELGARAVPLNVRFVGEELVSALANADIRALVTTTAEGQEGFDPFERLLAALPSLPEDVDAGEICTDAVPALRHVVVVDERAPAPFCRTLRGLRGAETFEPDPSAAAPDDVALLLYTSGTTRRPNACMLTHDALLHNAHALAHRFRLTSEDTLWDALPMFHISSILPMLAIWSVGGRFVSQSYLDTSEAVGLLADERVTVAFAGFDTVGLAIVEDEDFDPTHVPDLRVFHTTGTAQNLERIQTAIPQAVQTAPYGCTESTGLVSTSELDDTATQRARTSGRPLDGFEVRIDDGSPSGRADPDVQGEIVVRGRAMFSGYHRPAPGAGVVDADGWFRTGDLGAVDADGRIVYQGRLKDMLKVGGENVAAVEIEAVLTEHPDVIMAQVVGIPDDRLVEVPAAFVELRAGAYVEAETLIDHCRSRVASFKVPRHVRVVTSWPMSTTKIHKPSLLAEFIGGDVTQPRA